MNYFNGWIVNWCDRKRRLDFRVTFAGEAPPPFVVGFGWVLEDQPMAHCCGSLRCLGDLWKKCSVSWWPPTDRHVGFRRLNRLNRISRIGVFYATGFSVVSLLFVTSIIKKKKKFKKIWLEILLHWKRSKWWHLRWQFWPSLWASWICELYIVLFRYQCQLDNE